MGKASIAAVGMALALALSSGCTGDGNSQPGDSVAMADPGPGDPTAGDTFVGDPAAGDPQNGDPAEGDPSVGDPSSGDTGAGDPLSGDPLPGGDPIVPVVGYATIQLDLDNVGGTRGSHPSCTTAGAGCHQNMARNVWIIPNPTAQQLQDNYQRIINTLGTPWVTPANDSAQMLNEVAIPDHIHARWLTWIEAGAPFDAP